MTSGVLRHHDGGPRRSIICDYPNAKGAVTVAKSTCHSGIWMIMLKPHANAAPGESCAGVEFYICQPECEYAGQALALQLVTVE